MAALSWNGVSGDWTQAADWSGGAVPGATDSVTIGGAGAFTLTLYSATPAGGVIMNAANALFYDAGALTLGGVFSLQAGTLALAYGSLIGGTLALAGGTLAAEGGMLNGVAVQGALNLSQEDAALVVQNGLAMSGAGGSGAGSIALTGGYASLDFLGTQTLANAVVTFGANQGQPALLEAATAYGATSNATLTLAANVWLREAGQGQIILGGGAPSPYASAFVNKGTITAGTSGSTLTIGGQGAFTNQGTLSVSNGATLDIASTGFTNTGTLVVNNATLDFGGTFASSLLGSLGALALTQGTVEIGGDAMNGQASLAIGAGSALGALDLAGTITGGTLVDSGGGLNLSAGTGALDGVTYEGTLVLGAGAAMTLLDGTVLATAGGAGNAAVTGAGASLLLEGATALDNATLSLGSNNGAAASLGTADTWLASAATTATLGGHLLVQHTGKFAAVDANATTPFPGYGLSDTLVNQGTIAGAFAGGTLTLGGYGTLINQGTIAISNGDTLDIAPGLFSNTGTISVAGGATAILGGATNIFGQAPVWSNTGLISLAGGTLVLSGQMRTAQIGRITGSGSLTLAGTLANAGSTLTLGTGGQLPALSLTGTIGGGTLADPGGLLEIGAGGTALLDGVTETGTLNLTQQGAWLRVRDGLSLTGVANVTGAGAEMAFSGTQAFDKALVNLGAAGSTARLDVLQDPSTSVASTLTLGPDLSIVQAGALAALGGASDTAGDAIVDFGTIAAAVAGGTFCIAGAGFTNRGSIGVSNGDTLALSAAQFSNAGTIAVTNAGLEIADSLSLAALGDLVLSDAAISVAGTLNEAGGTLAIGAGSAWGRISLTGTIAGGVILDTGGGLNAAGGATLADVAYEGVLDLSRPSQQIAIANGLTLTDTTGTQAGTMMLTGAASRVLASTSETLANATIYLGSASQTYLGQHIAAPELDAAAGTTLTLAANTMLRSAGPAATLGNCSLGGWTDTIVNDGTILESAPGGLMTLGSSFLDNAGSMVIGNTGSALFTGVDFTNTGAISLAGGSALSLSLYGYYAAPDSGPTMFTNSGTIHMVGGMLLENTGNGLFPAVPMVNAPGGLIQGFGNIVGPLLNNATVEAKFGPNLDIAGAMTGVGTVQIDTGCVLELGGAVASTQTVSFTATGETLRLDSPQSFAGSVANFTSGDAIDVTGSQVNTVAISAGTLVLGTSFGVFKLNSVLPLGGALSVGADHHGGDSVLYTAQSNGGTGTGGGTATVLEVTQPKMLFWASPVGDEFQGAAANLNGAQIANWTTADSLDFVDLMGTQTTVAYAQATGQGTITVTSGSHTAIVGLLGTYNATWFHVTSDAHGGALITYSHP